MMRHYIIPIFVPHKGCPHDCVFCNQRHITGQIKEVDSLFVESEIEKYLKTIRENDRFVEVSFFGGSFTGLPIKEQTDLLKPAKKALDKGRIDAIRLSTRPDYIDSEILDNLKQYGVSIIELGVQSMDEMVLKMSNRGHGDKEVYKSSSLIKEYGFTLGLQMMIGLPGDDEEKDTYTAKEFVKIGPQMVRIYPALVVKDTYMERMYKDGRYEPFSLERTVNICSRLYLIFERAGIDIIRIGLQPTENIQPGRDVVGGPFHPAIRELVESKLLNEIVLHLFKTINENQIFIHINSMSISKLYSDKKKYFKETMAKVYPAVITVVQDDSVPIDGIEVRGCKNSLFMSIKDYSLID